MAAAGHAPGTTYWRICSNDGPDGCRSMECLRNDLRSRRLAMNKEVKEGLITLLIALAISIILSLAVE